jgi:hypothetical protein
MEVIGLSSRKGQVFSVDLVVGIMLSIIAMGILCAAWGLAKARLDEARHLRGLEDSAYEISDLLAKSPGSPVDWETDPENVSVLGLAKSDRRLSASKVEALKGVEEERLKQIFGLSGGGCFLSLRSSDDVVSVAGVLGDSDSAVTSTRIVSYLNQTMFLDVTVWDDGPEILL